MAQPDRAWKFQSTQVLDPCVSNEGYTLLTSHAAADSLSNRIYFDKY